MAADPSIDETVSTENALTLQPWLEVVAYSVAILALLACLLLLFRWLANRGASVVAARGLAAPYWGAMVSIYYVFVLFVFFAPLSLALFFWGADYWPATVGEFWDTYWEILGEDAVPIWIAVMIGGQALLLFLSVDTSFRRHRPRAHIGISITVTTFMVTLLCLMAVTSIVTVDTIDNMDKIAAGWWFVLWGLWVIVFFVYRRGYSDKVERIMSWLIKGSVLELLIVVPCHVLIRQRGECSAPIVSGAGIATGIAVMLMAFGPSVYFLYKKQLDEYEQRRLSNAG